MKVALYTLGCKANQYDTKVIEAALDKAGHEIVPFGETADAYIINTCTVTAESDRQARQVISRAARANPEALIAVCGCYAQRDAQRLLEIDSVDVVAGTNRRSEIAEIIANARKGEKQNYVTDIMLEREYGSETSAGGEHAREYIKIQDGCDRYCTYCIIPHTRGPVRSKPLEDIFTEAEMLAEKGYNEAVLTGIRIASYGKESGKKLFDAVEAVERSGIYRVRLGSLDPDCVDEDFVRCAAQSKKLCRHFHLSLQSGSDTVLKRMGRRYTSEQYYNAVQAIREAMPDAVFSTDVMCGFPGESEQEFFETLEFVQKVGFMKLHVFKYSRREGTPAASMRNQIIAKVKQERAAKLIAAGDRMQREFLQSLENTVQEVIFEQQKGGLLEGHARNYALIKAAGDISLIGKVANVLVERAENDAAFGRIML